MKQVNKPEILYRASLKDNTIERMEVERSTEGMLYFANSGMLVRYYGDPDYSDYYQDRGMVVQSYMRRLQREIDFAKHKLSKAKEALAEFKEREGMK